MNLYQVLTENKHLEYYRILKWLTKKKKDINEVCNISGRILEFVDDAEYSLYAGILLSHNKRYKSYRDIIELKINRTIDHTIFEWHKDIHIVRKNLSESLENFGIIVKEKINPKEVIFDLEYIDDNNEYFKNVMLASSLVYTKPLTKNFTIVEIIE